MEALYLKLHDKYIKLKTMKDSESDKINRDQEVKFMNYVSAADELIEHLRNENNRLKSQISNLRGEEASIRSTNDQQHAEYQVLLMAEIQKNKQLSEEIQRLQYLCCKLREDNIENGELNTPVSLQIGSGMLNESDANITRKRRRDDGTAAEVTAMPSTSDQVEHVPVRESASDLSKQTVSCGTGLKIDKPECCRRQNDLSGGDVNITGPSNCMFQDLIECLVGMKLSAVAQTDGTCISAAHQSSGYSFSLTWVNKASGDEAELLYRVSSLGTFERVAPEWMREVIMFSLRMCPIFFQRVSRVIGLHHS